MNLNRPEIAETIYGEIDGKRGALMEANRLNY